MTPTVLQNCVIQMQDAAPPFFTDFLETHLRPHSSKEDNAKDSRGKKGEPVLEREFIVSFRPLPLPACYLGYNNS